MTGKDISNLGAEKQINLRSETSCDFVLILFTCQVVPCRFGQRCDWPVFSFYALSTLTSMGVHLFPIYFYCLASHRWKLFQRHIKQNTARFGCWTNELSSCQVMQDYIPLLLPSAYLACTYICTYADKFYSFFPSITSSMIGSYSVDWSYHRCIIAQALLRLHLRAGIGRIRMWLLQASLSQCHLPGQRFAVKH